MHRRRLPRALSLVFALWIGLLATGPLAARACPMHAMQGSMAGGAMHPGHGHDGHAPAKGAATDHCVCLGLCSGNVAAPLAAADLPPVLRVAVRARSEREPVRRLPARVAHLLPFAQAPPRPL